MPPRRCVFDHAGLERDHPYRKQTNAFKRERKIIATYYRWLRNSPDYGPKAARRAHYHGQVTRGHDAKYRLKELANQLL